MTTAPVFLLDRLPSGAQFVLDGPEGRHAATVRRLRVGETVVLGDGRGSLAECVVEQVDRDSLRLGVVARRSEVRPAVTVRLAQALLKGDRGELAVELATEAGVDAVLPWRAERCVARWEDGPRTVKARAKWQATVREAAKQSRRAWCPEVAAPVTTGQLANIVRECAGSLVLHETAELSFADVPLPKQGELLLIVGPEGGISPTELATLTAAGATPVQLGHTVLRASTAATVALGALGARTSRWR